MAERFRVWVRACAFDDLTSFGRAVESLGRDPCTALVASFLGVDYGDVFPSEVAAARMALRSLTFSSM